MTMSIDGTPSSGQDDDTGAATASSDRDRRAEQAGAQQASTTDARGQQRPESLTREEYADAMRESGPPIQGSRDGQQAADDGEPGGQADLGAGRADGRDGTGGPPADGETDAAASAVTHFHGEFKGRPLDLYTDGTRWASADQARGEDTVGETADILDRPPAGEELVDSAGDDSSRLERFRRELYRESDDALDSLEKNANLVHDVFSHPPTSSYEVTPADGPYISETQHSGIDAGSIATAAFVLGVVIDRGVRSVVQHYKEHARGE